MRCPKCDSAEVDCDGKVHRCLTCGYDGQRKTSRVSLCPVDERGIVTAEPGGEEVRNPNE
jgi:hypothetical protein